MTLPDLTPQPVRVIAATPAVLMSMLGGMPEYETSEVADAGGWTARDVTAHLLDRWPLQRRRLNAMLDEDNPVVLDENEAESLERSGLRGRPLRWLLSEFERARSEHTARYAELTHAQLERQGEHSVAGPVTVAEMLSHVAHHDLNHAQQIAAILATVSDESRGAMQRFS